MRAIAAAHGPAHLALCFRLCTETGNARELHAATLQALSFPLAAEVIPIGSALFDAFDRIDLGYVRAMAKAMPGNTAHDIAALLSMLAGDQMFQRAGRKGKQCRAAKQQSCQKHQGSGTDAFPAAQ